MRIILLLLAFLFCLSSIYAAPSTSTQVVEIDTNKIISQDTKPADYDKTSSEFDQNIKDIDSNSFYPKLKLLIDDANFKPKDSIFYSTYLNENKATLLDLKLNDAAKLYIKKDYAKALKIYNEIILKNEDKEKTILAIQYKAQIFNINNSKDSLKKTLNLLVKLNYSNLISITSLRNHINLLKKEGNYSATIELYKKIIGLDSSQKTDINNEIIDIYILKKEYSKAQEMLNNIIASDTSKIQLSKAYYSLAIIALNSSNELGDGLMNINKSIENDPKSKKSIIIKAKINFSIKDYEKALVEFQKVLDSTATSDLYYYAGISCFMIGKDNDAIKYLNKVSGKELALYFKALSKRFLAKEGGVSKNIESSKKDLTNLMKKCNDPHVKYLYCLLLMDEKKVDEATMEIEQLIKDFPEFVKGYQARADLLIKKKKYKEAKKDLLYVLSRKGQSDVYTLMKLAYLETESKKYKQAIRILEAARAISPRSTSIYIQLSNNYFLLKNVNEAEANLKIALQIDPNNEIAYIELAKIFLATKRGKYSIEICDNILKKLNKKSFFAYVYKGLGQISQKEVKNGCESIKSAKDIAKTHENKNFLDQVEALLAKNCGIAPSKSAAPTKAATSEKGVTKKEAAPEKEAAPVKTVKKRRR